MTVTISRLYDSYADGQRAVTDLEAAGVPHSDISIVSNNSDNWYNAKKVDRDGDGVDDRAEGAGKGAGVGAGLWLFCEIMAVVAPTTTMVVATPRASLEVNMVLSVVRVAAVVRAALERAVVETVAANPAGTGASTAASSVEVRTATEATVTPPRTR